MNNLSKTHTYKSSLIIKRIIGSLTILLLLSGCFGTDDSGKNTGKVSFITSQVFIDSFDGGIKLYGINLLLGKSFSTTFFSDVVEFDIPPGPWVFFVMAWEGPTDMAGTLKCGFSVKSIEKGILNPVFIVISEDECGDPEFASSTPFFDGTKHYDLKFITCRSTAFAGIVTSAQNCDGLLTSKGWARSYRLALPDFADLSTEEAPGLSISAGLTSECINADAGNLSMKDTDLTIPVSGNNLPLNTVVVVFPEKDCGGAPDFFVFDDGFINGIAPGIPEDAKVLKNDTFKLTMVYLENEPGAAADVSIEKTQDGDGQIVNPGTIGALEKIELWAILKDIDGRFVGHPSTISWTTGLTGSFTPSPTVVNADFTPTAAGVGQISVTADGFAGNTPIFTVTEGAKHEGWTEIFAVGPKTKINDNVGTEVVQAEAGQIQTLCGGTTNCVRLRWNAFTSSGTIQEYRIFRKAEGGNFDYTAAPLQVIAPGTRLMIDTTITAGTVYHYHVLAKLVSGEVLFPTGPALVRIMAPPNNMFFVHRWMANTLMCSDLTLTTDPENNFRCTYTGLGNSGGFFDIGQDYLVDRFEMGCNYTINGCSTHDPGGAGSTTDCIGVQSPITLGVTPSVTNAAFYDRNSHICYVHDGTTWKRTDEVAANATLGVKVVKNTSAIPPVTNKLDQVDANNFCSYRSITMDGQLSTGRLPRRVESITAFRWDPALSGASKVALEEGVGANDCNADQGHGLAFTDSTYPPAIVDELPSNIAGLKVFSTGSASTNTCVSFFGAQDGVGNIQEYNSGQFDCTAHSTSNTCLSIVPSHDTGNNIWSGYDFDGVVGPGGAGNFYTGFTALTPGFSPQATFFNPVLGVPAIASVNNLGAFDTNNDAIELLLNQSPPNNNRPVVVGGSFDTPTSQAGVYAMNLSRAVTDEQGVGFRCAFPFPPL